MKVIAEIDLSPEEIISGTSPREAHLARHDIPGPAYCGIQLTKSIGDEIEAHICERCRVLWMQERT
jgi:hypothetical protein